MRIREENCNMVLLAVVALFAVVVASGATLVGPNDNTPVRLADRTTASEPTSTPRNRDLPTSQSSMSAISRRSESSARRSSPTPIRANVSRASRTACAGHPDAPCARWQDELSPFCHLARKSAAVIHRHLHTSLIPQKPFDGVAWAEVFHEMDEGTRSPDRADDGVRSIGDRQEAGRRAIRSRPPFSSARQPSRALPTLPKPTPARRCRHRGDAGRERSPFAEPPKPAPIARLDLRDEFQSEIQARVANFRAHQERFNREREAYCSATMAKVHAVAQGQRAAAAAGQIARRRFCSAYFLPIFSSTGSRCVRNACGSSLIGKWPRPFMMVTSQPAMLFATASVSSGVQE